jgi:hypothetical protein
VTLVLPAQANATLVLITSDDSTVVQVQLRKVGLDEGISQATFEKRSIKLRPAHFALLFRVTVVEIAQQLVVRQSPIVAAVTKSNINQRGVALSTERAVNLPENLLRNDLQCLVELVTFNAKVFVHIEVTENVLQCHKEIHKLMSTAVYSISVRIIVLR